jgi:hypothetical protein
MFQQETYEDAVLYLLKGHPEIKPSEMVALLYIADVYHLLLFGRTITDSIRDTHYMLMEVEDMEDVFCRVKDKKSKFEYLSESDRKALDFAYNRGELEKDGFGIFPVPVWEEKNAVRTLE